MKKPIILIAAVAACRCRLGAGASQRDSGGDLVYYGNVDIRQISLAFDGNGRVQELRAEEGDRVRAGAVLAVLDTRTLALQADQARAQMDAQQQTLLRLRNGSRPEEIAQARSRLVAAQADAARAQQDLARLRGIAANTQGAASAPRTWTAPAAPRRWPRPRRRTARSAAPGRGRPTQGRHRWRRGPVAGHAGPAGAAAAPDLAGRTESARRRRGALAPAGAGRHGHAAAAGLRAGAGAAKWVRIYVGEADLGKVKPGMAARVQTDSQPDKPIAGKVGYISSVAEFTPKAVQTEELRTSLVYEVRVRVDDPQDALRLGQPATVRMAADAAQ